MKTQQKTKKNTIILAVRIDYTHQDYTESHQETAASMVVNAKDTIHAIVDGVEITNVEAYLDGAQII